jgi:hypothetical protein
MKSHILIPLAVFVLILCSKSVNSSSSKSEEKFIKKVKHYENAKTAASTRFACSDFNPDSHPIVEKRTFMPTFILVKTDFYDHSDSPLSSALSFYEKVYDLFYAQCHKDITFKRLDSTLHELTWRYQFYESQHCIRVELDFGNATRFREIYELTNYMFSFREFTKKNIHMKRQEIVDNEVNSLTIHRVNIRPYVVCVSFFKQNKSLSTDNLAPSSSSSNMSTVSSTNETTNDDGSESGGLSCEDLESILAKDERVHDVDLCVDIDTQVHFLSGGNSGHHSKMDRELVMVIFIMCLLVVILACITLANHIIEKPKKEALRKKLGDLIHKHTTHGGAHQSLINSANSLNNNKGSRDSLKNAITTPAITLSDYSRDTVGGGGGASSSQIFNRVHSPNNFLEKLSESENEESDPLLNSAPIVTSMTSPRVKFDIGEVIQEEESPAITQKNSSDKIQSDPDSNTSGENETDKECLKTISHLLDDKPWSTDRWQAGLTNPPLTSPRQSFANVLPTVSSNARINLNE